MLLDSLEPKKIAKPSVVHIEKSSKVQNLLRQALQQSDKPIFKLPAIEWEEERKNRGQLVDFIDEAAAKNVNVKLSCKIYKQSSSLRSDGN